MKVKQLVEVFIHKKSGGNTTPDLMGKLHPEFVKKYMALAWNTIIYEAFKKDLSNLDLYCKSFTVPVQYNTVRAYHYCTLPAPICQLPVRSEGVRRVQTIQDIGLYFSPCGNDQSSVMSGLEVWNIDETIPYAVELTQIVFKKHVGFADVVIDMVIPFDSFDDEDEFPMPMGQDIIFFQTVDQLMSNMPPEDDVNDNSSKVV